MIKRTPPAPQVEEASPTAVLDWRTLEDGIRLEVRERNQPTDRGRLDGFTEDGTIVWIIRDEGAGRVIVEETPHTTLHLLEVVPAAHHQSGSSTAF